jgi:hypothetical protein
MVLAPYLLDLNPCDYFLWGFLKGEITVAVVNITEEAMAAVMENSSQHQQIVLDAQGSHTEYVFI